MPRQPDPELQARDERMAAAVASGESVREVAEREGITPRNVRARLQRLRRRQTQPAGAPMAVLHVPPATAVDPVEEVAITLAALRQAEDGLREIAAGTGHDAAKVGALARAAQIAVTRLSVLDKLGMLPTFEVPADRSAWWSREVEWRVLWGAVVRAADEAGLDVGRVRELVAAEMKPTDGPTVVLVRDGPDAEAA